MKKFLSAVLSLVMILSMIPAASAAPTVDSTTTWVPNPLELPLELRVLARETGSGNPYESAPSISFEDGNIANIDYRAELNMLLIRNFFEATYFTQGSYDKVKEEFDRAPITTEINVVIEFPSQYVKSGVDLNSTGALVSDNGIFEEKSRQINGNKATITYINEPLTAGELYTNYKASGNPANNSYLADLAFELNDALAYADEGEYVVSVTMSGKTTIDFASKKQVVEYVGGSQNIVTISKYARANHVLEVVPAKPATCKEDGHTQAVKCKIHDSYDCGAYGVYKPQSIPKLNHMISGISLIYSIPEIPATCATDGIKAHET